MKIEANLRIFITGKTQSGKSYLAKSILQQFNNRVIYDIKREYSDLGLVVRSFKDFERAIKGGCNKVVYQPEDLSQEHFNDVCGFIYKNLKNIMFCVDEVHNFCTKSFIPFEFKKLITITQGDPYRIGVISITQRPANTHNDVISNSSLYIAFKLNLRNDIKAVEESTGIPEEQLRELPYRWFFVYNDRSEKETITKHKPL